MLLAIDIGNTSILFGLFKGFKISKLWQVPTQKIKAKNKYIQILRAISDEDNIEDIIICSVVPAVLAKFRMEVKRFFKTKPFVLGQNCEVPIKNLYRNPKQAGQDRLANAYGALRIYGAPLIVVDFGTAITFDVVSKKDEFLGGLIFPGLEISMEALSKGTALLPRVKLKSPRGFLGRDTKSCIINGAIYGFSALSDCLVEKLNRKFGEDLKVIVTGGQARLLKKNLSFKFKLDLNLTLKALRLIYEVKSQI